MNRSLAQEFQVEPHSPAAVRAVQSQLVSVYRAAFRPPPYEKQESAVRQFADVLGRHTVREGFRAFVARPRDGGAAVGFAYGYSSRSGQWWYNHVARALEPADASYWLGDAFELVELAVAPDYQGLGLGGRLHDELLHDLPNRTAVLSTLDAETAGFHLYRKRGWRTLLNSFHFPGVSRRYLIMGREL